MYLITLDSETDFDGWRKAARTLALHQVAPADVTWGVQGQTKDQIPPGLSEAPSLPPIETEGTFSVPANFIELARIAVLHRDGERFTLLYRLLWRLKADHDLLDTIADPDVTQAAAMAGSVQRDAQRMRDLVRFREIGREQKAHYAAWFEPEHYIVAFTAPFFARRFADMPWSILTPDVCAHWDGHTISFTPGISRTEWPAPGRLEETWRRHFQSDRLTTTNAPVKRRRNLEDASILGSILGPLLADAERWTGGRIAPRSEALMTRKTTAADDLETLREEAAHCRACPLYKDATQTVFGEGPQTAQMMLVGEQPGDKEDLAGKPFVGPAGRILDDALARAGIARGDAFVTNAVKHFKFEQRGKRRLHKRPNSYEIERCQWWLQQERTIVRPVVIVAMGATAARSLFGRVVTIGKLRGRMQVLADGTPAFVTIHPSYLLRIQEEADKRREHEAFVADLRLAGETVIKSAAVA